MTALMAEVPGSRMASAEGYFEDAFADWRWQVSTTALESPELNPNGHQFMQVEVAVFRDGRPDPFRLRTYHLFPEEG
jgi:hypothetical protein